MHNFKDDKVERLLYITLAVVSIIIVALLFTSPMFRHAMGYLLKVFVLWSLYGAVWFIIPALLVIVSNELSIYLRIFKFAFRIRKGPTPSVGLAMAYVMGFFTTIVHVAIWAIWW